MQKYKTLKGWQSYEYPTFEAADRAVTQNGFRHAGSDNCLGHIYEKTVAGQSYSLHTVYSRIIGNLNGNYKVERVEPA